MRRATSLLLAAVFTLLARGLMWLASTSPGVAEDRPPARERPTIIVVSPGDSCGQSTPVPYEVVRRPIRARAGFCE